MNPLEFLNQVYIVNPRGLDPSLVEAAAGGLRDRATKQMVRQARPVGGLLMKHPGLATKVGVGAVALTVAGVVVANRKPVGEQVKRRWGRVAGRASTPDAANRVYDPWPVSLHDAEDDPSESTTSPANEKPPASDVD